MTKAEYTFEKYAYALEEFEKEAGFGETMSNFGKRVGAGAKETKNIIRDLAYVLTSKGDMKTKGALAKDVLSGASKDVRYGFPAALALGGGAAYGGVKGIKALLSDNG